DGETTWRFGNARARSNRRCHQNQEPTEQSHGCLLALWVCVRRTECEAMAIADMPVLRQSNATSGSPIECDHIDLSDQSILTRGTAFGEDAPPGLTVLRCQLGIRVAPDGQEREPAMARRRNHPVVVRD